MSVDWTKPIEAVEKATGRVVSVAVTGHVWEFNGKSVHGTNCPDDETTNGDWYEDGSDYCKLGKWFIRNTVTPTPAINWLAGTVVGPAVPQGFAEVMKHTVVGADITGILISASDTMSITTPNGTFEFRIVAA